MNKRFLKRSEEVYKRFLKRSEEVNKRFSKRFGVVYETFYQRILESTQLCLQNVVTIHFINQSKMLLRRQIVCWDINLGLIFKIEMYSFVLQRPEIVVSIFIS